VINDASPDTVVMLLKAIAWRSDLESGLPSQISSMSWK